MGLVALCVLPALGTLLWVSRGRWRAIEAGSRAEAPRLARLAAAGVAQYVASGRDVLATLSHAPIVKDFDLPRAEGLFRDLQGRYPAFANIALADVKGPMVASAVPLVRPVDAHDRSWFQRALAAGGFAVGDYQIGRATGKATVNMADAVRGPDGALRGLVFVALDLEVVHRQLADLQLGPAYVVAVVDASGNVCSRTPDPAGFVGRPLPPEAAGRAALARPGEVVEGPGGDGPDGPDGPDGEVRLYAAAPVPPGGLSVVVGVSRDVALAEATAAFRRSLAVLAGVAALALAAAWIVGGAWVVRPIRRLGSAAERVGAGDLAARSGISGAGEIGGLARAFDGMAGALETRAAEAAEATRALRAQAVRLDVLHGIDAAILASDSIAAVAAPALAHLRRALGADRATLSTVDPAAETMELLGVDDERTGAIPAGTKLSLSSLPGLETLRAGRTWSLPDFDALPELPPALRAGRDAGLRATVVVPLLAGGQWIGILGLSSRTAHALDAVDPRLLQEVADQLAIALTQARLREALRRERDLLETRVAERTAALEEANAELDAFAYSVSHDLRAPLRAMDGFSRAILEDAADRLDDDGRDCLGRIRGAAREMAQLIEDLLALSRVSRAEMRREAVDLSALAQAVGNELRASQLDRAVDLSVEPGLAAHGDPSLLRSVLRNLLGNAWKFTGKAAAPRVEFGRIPRDGETAYFVRDNGAGFDMAYSAKLFAPFQRLHSAAEFPGTGVGLATVARIVRRHGGRAWAEGVPGRGATFYFTLSPPSRASGSLVPT